MRHLFFFCAAFSLSLFAATAPHSTHFVETQNVQVLLVENAPEAILEVTGPYKIFNPEDGMEVGSGLIGKRFLVRALGTGIKWGEEFVGIHQIYLAPNSERSKILFNGIQYDGAIAIFGVNGKIHVVNDLNIEDFVKAELSSQFLAPMEKEVLSALAIVARTNAHYAAGRYLNRFWHIKASDVGYQGAALIVPDSPIEEAVDSTKNFILVHNHDGESVPFAALWTEHSGGKTAPFHAIFRKDAFAPATGVEAPHAAIDRQQARWTYQISRKALANILSIPQVKSAELFVDEASNKVYGVRIKDGVDAHDFDFIALQEALGKNHLKSSDFTLAIKEDSVLFSGYGRGHGVGLCLHTAAALAQNGENAVKILARFFPETYLLNLSAYPPMTAELR